MRGPAVANAQAALQQGSGGFAEFQYQADCVFEQLVVIVFAELASAFGVGFLFWSFKELLLVLGFALRAPELDYLRDLVLSHQWSVQALHPRRPGGEEEHIATSQ